MASIWIRRAYVEPGRSDGQRILVDRLWPRGVSKQRLAIDEWCKDLAPGDELRKWFDHDPSRWEEFKRRYADELDSRSEAVSAIEERLDQGRVTLVYGAKDEQFNNAVALKAYLEQEK